MITPAVNSPSTDGAALRASGGVDAPPVVEVVVASLSPHGEGGGQQVVPH